MPKPTVPLSGLRVLELGELLAGPLVGTLLGEFGAEVIKVERPGRGDVLRQFGPISDGESVFWKVNARNKKSIVLDLGKAEAKSILRDLLGVSDVLVNSLRPGTLESWGFTEQRLTSDFPRLVRVYASAYGRNGPYADKGGYDPIAQGFSGLSFLTGEADGPPMRAGGAIPVCDFMTGFAGALGAVIALYRRDVEGSEEKGTGGAVDIALYDVAFRMLGPLLAHYDLTGTVWRRDGNHSLGGAPTGHFLAKDGNWICTSVQNDEQFARLAKLVGRPEWFDDPRFKSLRLRTQNRDAIEDVVAQWFKQKSRGEILSAFEDLGLPVGPINSMADLAIDPHLALRSTFEASSGTKTYRQPRRVPKLDHGFEPNHGKSPSHGEHTVEVLDQLLKYPKEKVDALLRGRVVATAVVGFSP
ncbi:MAG: CaiB/BaiF CoA transferase family protein [Pseudomonadota bacterium]